jgi:hypothetical protein
LGAKQLAYAEDCRETNRRIMNDAEVSRRISSGLAVIHNMTSVSLFEVRSVLAYQSVHAGDHGSGNQNLTMGRVYTAIVYIHGGGLLICEADSEEIIRRRTLRIVV